MNAPHRSTTLKPLVLCAAALALALAPAWAIAGDAPKSAPSIEEIRREVDAVRHRIRSLYVEATSRNKSAGSAAGQLLEIRHVLAAKGPLRYAEMAHRTPPLDWSEDIGYTRSYFTGKTFDAFYVLNRYYETLQVVPDEFSSTKIRAEFYIECTGWWPPDDLTTPRGLDPSTLLHVALADPACRVRPELEETGGVPCVVAEIADRDRLWLDPVRGFAIVRREFIGPSVRIRYENSDFREAAPGTWLPWRILRVVTTRTNPAAGETARDVVLSESDRTVGLLRVNDVDDAIFTFRAAPGTLIHDLDHKKVHQVPGGLDMMDEIIRAGRKFLIGGRAPSLASTNNPPPILAWALAVSALPALVLIGKRRPSLITGGARTSTANARP
ncbi:hypothetical protein [Singulisphaera acidiphila]|uniref:Uncharacterized protein n=1 Tax=Singulisphaera acidiphila (strain ATCC BAA-1392 / DSM 18658 / VKM B-2454 / MOB10) TaxID=886293 RepID=L0DHA0_SINAD|nr:hypothetical protein [Singulisphaera acidiphila]AGA28230.1 hypothetical protein Sinac_4007 [Singulisphaera acidiphila DSM 18658]